MHPATAHEPVRESDSPSSSEVLAQLGKLVSSRPLRESQQLQSFLDFVVRETLDGRSDTLKEYLLGCKVFHRRPDYDPRHDGIVRVQANALRKRLERYYAEEGVQDSVLIEVPRGAYVPLFRFRKSEPPTPAPPVLEPPAPHRPVPALRVGATAFALGFVFAGLLFAIWRLTNPPAPAPFTVTRASASDFPELWAPFLAPGANNLVAYGVPLFFSGDGLYLRDVNVNSLGTGDQTRVRRFAGAFHITPQPMDDLYTGVGETEATYRLSNFFATRGIPVRVVSARNLGRTDLEGHNLVTVSSLRFRTLLSDMRLPAEFVFHPTSPETIENLKPFAGEQREYVFQNGAGISTSYALASLWPGQKSSERIMHVGGVHTWATQAATEFLLQPEQLRKMAREFEKDRTGGARGVVSPYFQILLRVEGRGNQPHRVEYVTHHYLRP
jgi:hypothetical protein